MMMISVRTSSQCRIKFACTRTVYVHTVVQYIIYLYTVIYL